MTEADSETLEAARLRGVNARFLADAETSRLADAVFVAIRLDQKYEALCAALEARCALLGAEEPAAIAGLALQEALERRAVHGRWSAPELDRLRGNSLDRIGESLRQMADRVPLGGGCVYDYESWLVAQDDRFRREVSSIADEHADEWGALLLGTVRRAAGRILSVSSDVPLKVLTGALERILLRAGLGQESAVRVMQQVEQAAGRKGQ